LVKTQEEVCKEAVKALKSNNTPEVDESVSQ